MSETTVTVYPGHPEKSRAAVRRAILTRSDSDWSHYGITPSEKAAWVDEGIPQDRAYLAAMCRAAEEFGAKIRPPMLRFQLNDEPQNLVKIPGKQRPKRPKPVRLLDKVLLGINTLRLVSRIAGQHGWESHIDATLGLAVGEGNFPIDFVSGRNVVGEMILRQDPHVLPQVLDSLVALSAREIRAAQPRLALNHEVEAFLNGGAAGELLLRAGRVFGVYNTMDDFVGRR